MPDSINPLISPKHRLNEWTVLKFDKEEDWGKAIEIVKDRIEGRFVQWVDKISSEQFSGFAVIALDCLLLETLHGFMTGQPSKGKCSVYKQFLSNRKHFAFDPAVASSFCENVRNGMMHDTETRRKWLIEMTKPEGKIVDKVGDGSFILNRSLFHSALKRELEDWVSSLKKGDTTLRNNLRNRMDQVCKIHFSR